MMKESSPCPNSELICDLKVPENHTSIDILQKILTEVSEIKTCMNGRLTNLELKVAVLIQTCNGIAIEVAKKKEQSTEAEGNTNLGEKSIKPDALDLEDEPGKQFSIVPLSKESDHPNGCWLGDPKNPLRRVRCHILPINLTKINAVCKCAEKMALCLIDHLFTKEDLSMSNISGKSRTGKKPLNRLFIFAIQCHLEHHFSISTKDWQKICQNIDSKCRFLARRNNAKNSLSTKKKQLGSVKYLGCLKGNKECAAPEATEEINFYYESIGDAGIDMSTFKDMSETPCELRIINATPSQIDQLQQSHKIILEEILPSSTESKTLLIKDESITLETELTTATATDLDERMDDADMIISDDDGKS